MADLHLFPQSDTTEECGACTPLLPCWRHAAPPRERLSADARRTQHQREMLANGVHPATGRRVLDGWGFRCRDCAHAVRIGHGHRSWWKCELHRLGLSRSAASDIRASWPACNLLLIDPEAAR